MIEVLLFLATFLAAVAAVSSAISAIKSWSAAEKANQFAERALEVSLHDHKLKIVPDLVATLDTPFLLLVDETDDELISLSVHNNKHALYKVTNINWLGMRFSMKEIPNYPIELELGQSTHIIITFKKGQRQLMVKEATSKSTSEHLDFIFSEMVVPEYIRRELFSMTVENEMSPYNVYFHYDKEREQFVGRVQAVKTKPKPAASG